PMASVADVFQTMVLIITGIPVLAVYVVGILIAVMRYRRHPRVSLLTLVAFMGFLMLALVMPFVYRYLPEQLFLLNGELGVENTFRVLHFFHCCCDAGLVI